MDVFSNLKIGLSSPYYNAFEITPSNNQLEHITRAIYVGTDVQGGGVIELETARGDQVTLENVTAGSILPIRARRILPATTATNLVGLY